MSEPGWTPPAPAGQMATGGAGDEGGMATGRGARRRRRGPVFTFRAALLVCALLTLVCLLTAYWLTVSGS